MHPYLFIPGRLIATAVVGLCLLSSGCGNDRSSADPSGGYIDDGDRCVIRVRFTGEGELAAGDVGLDYTDVVGGFGEPGPTTRCRAVPQAVTSSVFSNVCDKDCSEHEKRFLELAFFTGDDGSEAVIHGPTDLARCDFQGDASTLERLHVLVSFLDGPQSHWYSASDIEAISECDGWTTTTTSSTTTSLCDANDCGAGTIPVEIWLDDPVTLVALDVRATFPCAVGGFDTVSAPPWDAWPGNGPIKCTSSNAALTLWATNQLTTGADDDPGCVREMLIGMVSLDGIEGPGALVTCAFHASTDSLGAGDFDVFLPEGSAVGLDGTDLRHQPAVSLRGFADSPR